MADNLSLVLVMEDRVSIRMLEECRNPEHDGNE
jgi:hypothetical protein